MNLEKHGLPRAEEKLRKSSDIILCLTLKEFWGLLEMVMTTLTMEKIYHLLRVNSVPGTVLSAAHGIH